MRQNLKTQIAKQLKNLSVDSKCILKNVREKKRKKMLFVTKLKNTNYDKTQQKSQIMTTLKKTQFLTTIKKSVKYFKDLNCDTSNNINSGKI